MKSTIPDWLRACWKRSPQKGDILFRTDPSKWRANASLGSHGVSLNYAYAEGYHRGGQILANYVVQEKWDQDFLVYPIVFLYRHHVELMLKRAITLGAPLTDQELSKSDISFLRSSHRLNQLWKRFLPILHKAIEWKLFALTNDEIESIQSYIRQLNHIDERSYSFRYEITQDGKPSLPDSKKLPHINIQIFAEQMEGFANYLYRICEIFDDTLQLKWEMQAEAGSDYLNDY
jgi:hypothetical protein